MKDNFTLAIVFAFVLGMLCIGHSYDVFFSPNGGCTKAIADSLGTIKNDSVFVQAYNFTSAPIGDALVKAKKAGNYVAVIVDYKASLQKGNQVAKCDSAGIVVYVDKKHPIAHNKIMIMGNKMVEMGSFNYSNNAESKNAENITFLLGEDYVSAYKKNWYAHKAHSVRR